jgi:hypothetical protein
VRERERDREERRDKREQEKNEKKNEKEEEKREEKRRKEREREREREQQQRASYPIHASCVLNKVAQVSGPPADVLEHISQDLLLRMLCLGTHGVSLTQQQPPQDTTTYKTTTTTRWLTCHTPDPLRSGPSSDSTWTAEACRSC